jgi:RNA polymerase sigma-70 factor (ECF subfamily)
MALDPHLDSAATRRVTAEPVDFRPFYAEALPLVYGYLLRRCGSVAAAEDLTQETFLAAVRELKKARTIDEPLAWVIGIARHKLVDHYRREQRHRAGIEISAPPQLEPEPSDGEVTRALAAVPHDQRLAIILRHVDGLSVPEVARALGRSVEAAESLLARGRSGFRRAYLEGTS